jgi:acetylornithine deacetylase/succinyl-diaminopimelate desuccinylase-like protein
LRKQDPQIDAEVELIRYRSPVEISIEETVVKTVGEALRRILSREPEFRGMISAADSEYLVNAGIPSIMFGPGSDHLAHATNEWIAIDDILTAVKVYTATCLEIT